MTTYDPIEIFLDGQSGYAKGPNIVRANVGYVVHRGYMISGSKFRYDSNSNGPYHMTVDLAWQPTGEEDNAQVPAIFPEGNPNIVYKVTVQAIDTTEEE